MLSVNSPRNVTILTLASSNYFFGLQVLVRSLRKFSHWPIAAFAHDLDIDLKRWLVENGVTLFELKTPLPLPQDLSHREYLLWVKPLLIRQLDATEILWVDADALAVNPIDGIVETPEYKDTGFLAIIDAFNPDLAYGTDELDIALGTTGLPPPRFFPPVNAGILLLDKSRRTDLLDSWIEVVELAFRNPPLRKLIPWHDQGALNFCIRKLNLGHKVISRDIRWNCPANVLTAQHQTMRRLYRPQTCFEQFQMDHPDSFFVHWNGHPKYWGQWPYPSESFGIWPNPPWLDANPQELGT